MEIVSYSMLIPNESVTILFYGYVYLLQEVGTGKTFIYSEFFTIHTLRLFTNYLSSNDINFNLSKIFIRRPIYH